MVTELVPPLTEATEAATFLAVSALAASAAALANAAALAKLGIHVELELNPSQLGGYLIRRRRKILGKLVIDYSDGITFQQNVT